MNVEITDSYPSISDDDILALEQDLDIKLPTEYKEFLKCHNGGSPSLQDYKLDGELFDDIGWFFGIRDYPSGLDIKTENEEVEDRLLKHYLAIGGSYGGNLICISSKKSDYGSIYRWDHETANYDGHPWEDNMTKISKNLKEFLSYLYAE
ncbi:MAG: SMI1/KNR4 family protein [Pseudomonadales bacterium]|nr:SMI1/KNR4 family protein [Pseudomonadales bacterium]